MSYAKALKRFLSSKHFSILVSGRRKSGKSALMYRLAELAHNITQRKCYVVNLPVHARPLLPEWIQPLERSRIDSVSDCILLFEEAALVAFSRNWYTTFNKLLSKLNAIAFHKNQSHIYVTQNMRLIDANVLSMIDVLFLKDYSYVMYKMEREDLRSIVGTAHIMLSQIPENQRVKYAAVFGLYDLPPFLLKYKLPSFWCEELAYVWSSYSFKERDEFAATSLTEQVEEIMRTHNIGHWRDLVKFFTDKNPQVLKTIFYRVRKRL